MNITIDGRKIIGATNARFDSHIQLDTQDDSGMFATGSGRARRRVFHAYAPNYELSFRFYPDENESSLTGYIGEKFSDLVRVVMCSDAFTKGKTLSFTARISRFALSPATRQTNLGLAFQVAEIALKLTSQPVSHDD